MARMTGFWIEDGTVRGPDATSDYGFVKDDTIVGADGEVRCTLRFEVGPSGHRIGRISGAGIKEGQFYVYHYRIYGPDQSDAVPWLH